MAECVGAESRVLLGQKERLVRGSGLFHSGAIPSEFARELAVHKDASDHTALRGFGAQDNAINELILRINRVAPKQLSDLADTQTSIVG